MNEEILADWAHRVGMDLAITDGGVVHGWADMEIGYDVRRDDRGFSVTRSDRGAVSPLAWFVDQDAADRMLLLLFGRDWRWTHGMRPTAPAELSPAAELAQGPTGWTLTWPGSSATFTRAELALRYSTIAGLPLTALAARLEDAASAL